MHSEKLSLNLKRITSFGLFDLCGMLIWNKNWVLPDQEKHMFFNLEHSLQNHSRDN